MSKYKDKLLPVEVDIGFSSGDYFSMEELLMQIKERIGDLNRHPMHVNHPFDLSSAQLKFDYDYDTYSSGTGWAEFKVQFSRIFTAEEQEEAERQRDKANAEFRKQNAKAIAEHERKEYERLRKKYEGQDDGKGR